MEILGRTLGRTDVFRLREEIGFVDARAGRRFAPLLSVEEVVRTGATQTIGYFEERLTAPSSSGPASCSSSSVSSGSRSAGSPTARTGSGRAA